MNLTSGDVLEKNSFEKIFFNVNVYISFQKYMHLLLHIIKTICLNNNNNTKKGAIYK